MKQRRILGYISIEVVITAAFILSVGFFALISFGSTGSEFMQAG